MPLRARFAGYVEPTSDTAADGHPAWSPKPTVQSRLAVANGRAAALSATLPPPLPASALPGSAAPHASSASSSRSGALAPLATSPAAHASSSGSASLHSVASARSAPRPGSATSHASPAAHASSSGSSLFSAASARSARTPPPDSAHASPSVHTPARSNRSARLIPSKDNTSYQSPGLSVVESAVLNDMEGRYLPQYVKLEFVGDNEQIADITRQVRQSGERKEFLNVLRQIEATTASSAGSDQAATGEKKIPGSEKEKALNDAFVKLANFVAHLCGADTVFRNTGSQETTSRNVDCCKPDICVRRQGDSSDNTFSTVTAVGEVKTEKNEDESNSVLTQFGRYLLSLVVERPCVSACHGFTLCGSTLRLWRFDAHTYACARAVDLRADAHVEQLVCLIAFLVSDEALVRWSPVDQNTFEVKTGPDSVEKYIWEEPPQSLGTRTELFGGRTCCWGGKARRSDGDVEDVVIKLAWIPPYLIGHEGSVLRHLEKAGVPNISRLHGTLQYPLKMRTDQSNSAVERIDDAAMAQQRVWLPEWSKKGMELDALVLKCPIGLFIKKTSKREMLKKVDKEVDKRQLSVLRMYRDLGEVLRLVAEAGVHYRDFNLGNILLAPASLVASSGLTVLLIDFGGARIGDQPRGNTSDRDFFGSVANLGLEFRLSADDARSANALFLSRQSAQAAEDVKRVIVGSRKVATLREKLREIGPEDSSFGLIQKQVQRAEKQLAGFEAALRSGQHRPTDDLESAFWCLLYQSGLIGGNLTEVNKLPGETFKTKYVTESSHRDSVVASIGSTDRSLMDLLTDEDLMSCFEPQGPRVPPSTESLMTESDIEAFERWRRLFDEAIFYEQEWLAKNARTKNEKEAQPTKKSKNQRPKQQQLATLASPAAQAPLQPTHDNLPPSPPAAEVAAVAQPMDKRRSVFSQEWSEGPAGRLAPASSRKGSKRQRDGNAKENSVPEGSA